MGNDDGSVMEWVVDVRQSLERTRRGLIDFCRALHAQSFVRSFDVVDLDEFVETRLLLQEIRGSWFGRFLFQSEMHTFMTAVLPRMTRLDAFELNDELMLQTSAMRYPFVPNGTVKNDDKIVS